MMSNMSSLSVFTKKMPKTSYHLATFAEPLTKEAGGELPPHVIEEPLPEPEPGV